VVKLWGTRGNAFPSVLDGDGHCCPSLHDRCVHVDMCENVTFQSREVLAAEHVSADDTKAILS